VPIRDRRTFRPAIFLFAAEAADCGALWAQFIIQYSKFRIKESGRSCGPHDPDGPACGINSVRGSLAAERTGLHERTCGTRGCSPPPGGGCGLPTSATSNLLQNLSAMTGGCGLPVAPQSLFLQNFSAMTGGCGLPVAPQSLFLQNLSAMTGGRSALLTTP